ncbi:MAG: mechanosensitive ion channel domain-containing protein [Candidatus Bathyarchaeia archaeon]
MVQESLSDWIIDPLRWLEANAFNIVFTLLFAVTVLGIIRFISRQVESLREGDRLDRNAAFLINRLTNWGGYIIIITFALNQFGFKISTVAGLLAVASGTVVGFAAMNTLGNAIAGIIVMTSRPFRIGDRILFQGISLIY